MVKAFKAFHDYILHSKVISYVPSMEVKYILTKPHIDERQGKWITKIQEYDFEIKPTKLVKGKGLENLMTYSNCETMEIHMDGLIAFQRDNPKENPQ